MAASLLGVAPAAAAIRAPGLDYGPTVLRGGLLWSGASGVVLSDATGTRLLVPTLALPEVLVQDGWIVAGGQGELRAGRSAATLAPIPALRRCLPTGGTGGSWLDALAGEDLYVILQGSCLKGGSAGQVLVRIPLSSRRLERVASVRAGSVSLVAAGRRLAVTYLTKRNSGTQSGRVRVDVLDPRSARRLYSLTGPPIASDTTSSTAAANSLSSARLSLATQGLRIRRIYSRTQIDAKGDVLVTGLSGASGLEGVFSGWWGNASTRVAHPVREPGEGTLSEGRIAYVSSRAGVQHLDVLNLATAATRTEVELRGSVDVLGVGLRKDRLAWAQQSYGYKVREPYPCVLAGPVGDPELAESRLSAAGPPIAIDAPSAILPAGPACAVHP